MIIAEIIRYNQPGVYRLINNIFKLGKLESDEIKPIRYVVQPEYPEDDYEYRETKYLMEERKGVAL